MASNQHLCIPLTDIQVPDIPRLDMHEEEGPGKAALETLEASIAEVGLINPLTVRKNPDGTPPYILVSGYHRYHALQRLAIPEVHVSVIPSTNDLEIVLIQAMENLCRRDLSALELTWSLGRAKEAYQALHPETKHGANTKTGKMPTQKAQERAVAFIDRMAAIQQRSRGNIGTFLTLYTKLGLSNDPERYATLLRDVTLAESKKELEEFAELTTEEQQRVIEHMRASTSLVPYRKAMKDLFWLPTPPSPQEDEETEEDVKLRGIYEDFCPDVQALLETLPALKTDFDALEDLYDNAEIHQIPILERMRDEGLTYDAAIRGRYEDFAPDIQAMLDELPALTSNRKDLWDLAGFDVTYQMHVLYCMRSLNLTYDAADTMVDMIGDDDEVIRGIVHIMQDQGVSLDDAHTAYFHIRYADEDEEETPAAEPTTTETEEPSSPGDCSGEETAQSLTVDHIAREMVQEYAGEMVKIYATLSPDIKAQLDTVPALKDNLTDLQDFASLDEEGQQAVLFNMIRHEEGYGDAADAAERFVALTLDEIYARFSPDMQAEIATVPELRQSKRNLFELSMWGDDDEDKQISLIRCMRDYHMTYDEAEKFVAYGKPETAQSLTSEEGEREKQEQEEDGQEHQNVRIDEEGVKEEEEEEEPFDLGYIVNDLYTSVTDYLLYQGVYSHCEVRIRKDTNTKGRTRIFISLQA